MASLQLRGRAASSQPSFAWFIGGGLLLASVVITVITQPALVPLAGTVGPALFSAALVVFAFGVRGSGSVTALRPLGTAALVVLAVWLLLGSVLYDFNGDIIGNDAPVVVTAFTYADSFVQFALALVAVIQIARLGVVPAPWKWVPTWVVAVVSVTWLVLQLVGGGSATVFGPNLVTWILMGLDGSARIGGTVLLGVIAIVLADRADRADRRSAATPPAVTETQL